jgi:hypothetical protein
MAGDSVSASPIEPAMPPEEWAAQLARSPQERRRCLLWAKDEADADGYLTIHGLAALALYGQPFGFDAYDRQFMQAMAAYWAKHGGFGASVDGVCYMDAANDAARIAAKIAALLPKEP